ncbi:hypothetical protein BCR33DRAFT_724510, partial [Rhizoclosmatium globosum]
MPGVQLKLQLLVQVLVVNQKELLVLFETRTKIVRMVGTKALMKEMLMTKET